MRTIVETPVHSPKPRRPMKAPSDEDLPNARKPGPPIGTLAVAAVKAIQDIVQHVGGRLPSDATEVLLTIENMVNPPMGTLSVFRLCEDAAKKVNFAMQACNAIAHLHQAMGWLTEACRLGHRDLPDTRAIMKALAQARFLLFLARGWVQPLIRSEVCAMEYMLSLRGEE